MDVGNAYEEKEKEGAMGLEHKKSIDKACPPEFEDVLTNLDHRLVPVSKPVTLSTT